MGMLKRLTHRPENGQMTIEYAVMVTVILAAAIWAGMNIIRPSTATLLTGASAAINESAQDIKDRF